MLVKKITTNEWKVLKEHGDIELIVELSKVLERERRDKHGPPVTDKDPVKGISRVTIGHAMRTGQMHEKTFEVINRFYKERKARQDKDQKVWEKAETDQD